jgi:hypothetical protein
LFFQKSPKKHRKAMRHKGAGRFLKRFFLALSKWVKSAKNLHEASESEAVQGKMAPFLAPSAPPQ